MEEIFSKDTHCGICNKEFELRDRIFKLPIFIREAQGGWQYDSPVLIDSDDVEYVHSDCLLEGRKQ